MKTILTVSITLILSACEQKGQVNNTTQFGNHDSTINKIGNEQDDSIDYERLGFDLMKSENLNGIRLGQHVSTLQNNIGEPNVKSKSEIWGSDGEYHQTYNYSRLGIKLDILGEQDSEKIVNMITIEDPCDFKTFKGISIGSDFKEVERAYKEYINLNLSNEESIVAGSIYGGMIFHFKNGKLISIFVGASSE